MEYKIHPMNLQLHLGRIVAFCLAAGVAALVPAAAQDRKNYFDDPFVQVTSALAGCPVPEGPLLTAEEARRVEHERVQHGTSCYLSGRCRLPSSYQYDKEIIPRVAQYIQRDGRFDDTSVWVMGQRRIVTLMGCVQSREQAQALERAVGLVDDVMNVVPQLMIGTRGQPPYKLRETSRPEAAVR